MTDRPKLPTREELALLGLRSTAAVAARVGQRAEPCFTLDPGSPYPPPETALQLGIAFARGDIPDDQAWRAARAIFNYVMAAGNSAAAWTEISPFRGYTDPAGLAAAGYAESFARDFRRAATKHLAAANQALSPDFEYSHDQGEARKSMASAITIVDRIPWRCVEMSEAVIRDYETAKLLDTNDPVDPSESGPFGPLWPTDQEQ